MSQTTISAPSAACHAARTCAASTPAGVGRATFAARVRAELMRLLAQLALR